MSYTYDVDLEFLRNLKSKDLNELVEILKGKDGDERITEYFTTNDLFKRFYPDHKQYIELVMQELQYFGGNTIANMLRGLGFYIKKFYAMYAIK